MSRARRVPMGLTLQVLWAGIWILTGIAIIAVVGRGLALATDGLSFEVLYPFLPSSSRMHGALIGGLPPTRC